MFKFTRVSDKLKCMYGEKRGKKTYSTGRLVFEFFRMVCFRESLIDCSVAGQARLADERQLSWRSGLNPGRAFVAWWTGCLLPKEQA
jgi:hypothetical protein